MIGTRLAHYEITAHLGSGGMGDVYAATDSKLGRSVALKLLPEAVASDADRLSRFRREAQLLASLNHPNIAHVYGLEESAQARAIVMELVAGETLQARLKRGAIPLAEALPIAAQICQALEAAHEKGVVHRDLKPGNVMLDGEGRVKVLDFGLAKAFDSNSNVNLSNSPTMVSAATHAGVILGTASYMSPEQARGKDVTRASDLFAFGAVLYEVLTGKQAFPGEHVSDILAAVLRAEPDWSLLPKDTPPAVRRLLQRCLQKDKRQRLQDATDARLEIQEAQANPAPAQATAAPPVRTLDWRVGLVGGICLVVAACIATGFVVWNLRPAPSAQPVSRLVVALPPAEKLAGDYPQIAISRDGTHLAFTGMVQSNRKLLTRLLNSTDVTPLQGTDGAVRPFFSPDGQWIGFFAGGKLRKVSAKGGAVIDVCTAPRGAPWATWGANNTIVFSTGTGPLLQVSADGGEPRALNPLKPGETSHFRPYFLPDGKSLLYTIGTETSGPQIAIRHLDTGEDRILLRGGNTPSYTSTGHLVYFVDGRIMAVPFDLARQEVSGSPSPVVEAVRAAGSEGLFDISSTGSLVYVAGGVQKNALALVDRSGAEKLLPAPPREYDDISYSPDGQRVVAQITENEQTGGVWIYDIPRGTLTRLSFDPSLTMPAWTADGKRVLYSLRKPGASGLYWKLADGSGPEERLTTGDFAGGAASASAAAVAFENRSNGDIWMLPFQGDRKATPIAETPFLESSPRLSPDGHWLAFQSTESGRAEVYVQPFPGPGPKMLLSADGGKEPIWSRNGHELFYRNGEAIMALNIQTQPSLKASPARMLFERKGLSDGSRQWDVAPDGEHFLMIKISDETEADLQNIHIVLNWFEELKRIVPPKP